MRRVRNHTQFFSHPLLDAADGCGFSHAPLSESISLTPIATDNLRKKTGNFHQAERPTVRGLRVDNAPELLFLVWLRGKVISLSV